MHDAVDLTGDSDQEEDKGRCPVCDHLLPLVELAAHCEAHFAEGEPQQDTGDPGTVHCGTCGACVPLGEYESHLLAHDLETDDLHAAELAQQQEGEVVVGAALDRHGEEALEQLYFQQLRQRYGFEDKVRPGNCFLCGEPGHYARECSRNPATQAAQARVIHPRAADILSTQQPARCIHVPSGLIPALAACLRQQALPASVGYQALLCGPVDHYQGEQYDQGWGCGWRNLQMQASNLLAARQDARSALFGGRGFVPDIPALQAWLECAWGAGFDRQGAEQLEGRVQGTRKWVGTTEAATVLRFFGLNACIIDFGTPPEEMAQVQALAAAAAAANGGGSSGGSSGGMVEVHVSVECDGCGCAPIVGPRYHSQVLSNYDLCGRCYQAQGGNSSPSGPFQRMLAARSESSQGLLGLWASHSGLWFIYHSSHSSSSRQAQGRGRRAAAATAACCSGFGTTLAQHPCGRKSPRPQQLGSLHLLARPIPRAAQRA